MQDCRTETQIMDQIRRIRGRIRELHEESQTKEVRAEARSLTERLAELNREHYAFYGDW